MTKYITLLCAIVLGSAAMMGCTNEVGEFLECAQVCESYDDCVGDAADATQCTDDCEDYADVNDANEAQVFECDNCLNTTPCSPDCNDVCAGIIPAF